MRLIHTADWHLGKKTDQHDRAEEHRLFLDWLLHTIRETQTEALIIAGDIFDNGSPANETLRMYYNFLVGLQQTGCRNTIIIGGNHDSISTLNAPRELLKAMQVHVTGGVPESPGEQIIPLHNADGDTKAVVAAVPFLRDRDIRLSIPGESATEREQRIREGIRQHYRSLLPLLQPYREQGIPVIGTGHLFVQGAAASDSEKEIHVGSLGQFPANFFPEEYEYVALGHLHRPQAAGGFAHIRYSGSPIPLSFSESTDTKQVLLLQTRPDSTICHQPIPVPVYRRLHCIKGTPEQVKKTLADLPFDTSLPLPAWVEAQVHTNSLLTHLQEELLELLTPKPGFGQLFLRQLRLRDTEGISEASGYAYTLADLRPEHVFDLRLQTLGMEEDAPTLRATFMEALQLMEQEDRV